MTSDNTMIDALFTLRCEKIICDTFSNPSILVNLCKKYTLKHHVLIFQSRDTAYLRIDSENERFTLLGWLKRFGESRPELIKDFVYEIEKLMWKTY